MKTLVYIYILAFTLPIFAFQEKELPPPGGEPLEFKIPAKTTKTLDNGLKTVLIPQGIIPKAVIRMSVATGNLNENKNQVWLSDLLSDLMEEGSTSKTAQEIADAFAGMGGNLRIYVTAHHTVLQSSVLSEFTDDAIAIMADILQHPKLPETELERIKNNMKRNITVRLSEPQNQAEQLFYSKIYGDHPYGIRYPKEEMVDSYSRADLKNFYDQNFGALRTTVYVAGKFDEAAVQSTIEESFANWQSGPEIQYRTARPRTDPSVEIIDRPDAPQSTLMYGLPVAEISSPDYIPLFLTNRLLGGYFSSRITSNIREDKGYTYSPRSTYETDYNTSLWYQEADVTTKFTGASLKEINKEINLLRTTPPTAEELEGVKNYAMGSFVLQNSSRNGIITQLQNLDLHNLDESFLTDRIKNIQAVTPEQVQQMAEKYLDPEKMTLVIVGDKKTVQEQIQHTPIISERLKN